MPKTRVYGLTGNIGCGKSTVAKFFAEFEDVVVLDADQISKELLVAEENRPRLLELFGETVFTDNRIDPQKLGRVVFSDRLALLKLENFLHPLVHREIRERTKPRDGVSFFIVEAALIFETGGERFFDAVIVADCAKEEQYRRLRENRGMTDAEIDQRLRWQMPAEEKLRRANLVINTDRPLEEIEKQIRHFYRLLKEISRH